MEKINYILKDELGQGIAIISASNEKELKEKTATAIKMEVSSEEDGQFDLEIRRIGDYGEDTKTFVQYVQDGLLITDGGFSLVKTVTY
jgi:hypothetical protein